MKVNPVAKAGVIVHGGAAAGTACSFCCAGARVEAGLIGVGFHFDGMLSFGLGVLTRTCGTGRGHPDGCLLLDNFARPCLGVTADTAFAAL